LLEFVLLLAVNCDNKDKIIQQILRLPDEAQTDLQSLMERAMN
jgi:hypothetical protein